MTIKNTQELDSLHEDLKFAGIKPLYQCETAADIKTHIKNVLNGGFTPKIANARMGIIENRIREILSNNPYDENLIKLARDIVDAR